MKKHQLEDSGERKTYESGGQKDPGSADLYGRFDLIPPEALERLALVYARGAKKYEARNWERGIPQDACIDAALRHINRWRKGESTEDHLAAAAFWLFAIMFFEEKEKRMKKLRSSLPPGAVIISESEDFIEHQV